MIQRVVNRASASGPRPPQVVRESPTAAQELALDLCEPVFLPIDTYADDRGWSFMNQLQGVLSSEGQINFSVQYSGVIKAWHRHKLQTDFWICLHGNLKAGVFREYDQQAWQIVMGEKRPGVLVIPPSLWHGAAAVGSTNAGLLYYVTHAYNPKCPDEERRSADSIRDFPWGVQHR